MTCLAIYFDITEVIGIVAVTQSLLLAIFLVTHSKGNKQSNKILAFLLIIYAICIPSSLIISKPISINLIIIAYICYQSSLLIGPFIFFYFSSVFDRDFHLTRKSLIHFLPFIIISLYLTGIFYISDDLQINTIFSERNIGIIFLVQSLIYLILSFNKLITYRKTLKPFYDKIQKPVSSWLKLLLTAFIVIWLININMFIVFDIYERFTLLPLLNIVNYLVLFIILNAIVFFSLKHSAIFTSFKKYENSTLSVAEKQENAQKLISYMEDEKLYLNPLLTLSHLSRKLLINRGHLSQIINETFHQHFNEFVNSYRIRESKRIMKDPAGCKMNILEIAYKVGYNSKSAFNRAFRKHAGITPKEYRNNNHG